MARRRARGGMAAMMGGTGADLNLTPLLDIIFNLIFFFVLATNIRERDRVLEITLPSSQTAETETIPEQVPEISLSKDGLIHYEGRVVTAQELEGELKKAVALGTKEVTLACDAQLAWQRVVDITDICRNAGVLEVTPRIRSEEPR